MIDLILNLLWRLLKNTVSKAILLDVTHYFLWIIIVDLILPLLEDVVDNVWRSVGLEKLGIVVGLSQHVVK